MTLLPGDPEIDRVLVALLAMQRQSWEQGVAGHAALDLGLDDLVVLLAGAAVTRQADDGRLGDVDELGAVNGAACGEVVLRAAELTGEPRWRSALDAQLRWLVQRAPRAADGTLFHLLDGEQVWADTVYMVVPLFAATGHVGLALRQVRGHRERLYDQNTGLYAARFDEPTGRLVAAEHWGTGNGWVVAAVARALRRSPDWPAGARDELARHARDVLDACLAHRRPDGPFGNVLDDPSSFPEANVAQMLAYAALVGAADGWLPSSYAGVGRDLLAATAAQVDERGVLTGVCGSPLFDRPGTSAEAQAFRLLASAAARRLNRRSISTQ